MTTRWPLPIYNYSSRSKFVIFKMSEKMSREKLRFEKLKMKVAENETKINELKSNSKIKCCKCDSTKINVIYCSSCGTVTSCKLHAKNVSRTKTCPSCEQNTVTRRWIIPFQQ